jgi:hypothetical protein
MATLQQRHYNTVQTSCRRFHEHGANTNMAAEKRRLTDAIVKRIPAPDKGYTITHDSAARGFAVRVTAKGVRSFILNYYNKFGRDRCCTIGQFPGWTTTTAHTRAIELRREIDAGGDPLADAGPTATRRASPN